MTTADPPVQQPHLSFARRVIGAFRLAPDVFEDIEHDPSALIQATGLVIAAGLARGIGAFDTEGVEGLIGSTAVGLVTWLLAGSLIWLVGVKRFGCSSNLPEVLRTLGFSAAPLLLLALGALSLGPAHSSIWVGAHLWAMVALVIAARAALDVDIPHAIGFCALAFSIGFALLALMGVFVAEWGAFD